jgi:hypothetical protein
MVHDRDTFHEEEAAVEQDDAAYPSAIGRALLGGRITKFPHRQSVGAVTGIVTTNMSIPLC